MLAAASFRRPCCPQSMTELVLSNASFAGEYRTAAVPGARGAASHGHGLSNSGIHFRRRGVGRWFVGTGERRRRAMSARRVRRSSGERTVARSVSGNQLLVTSTRKARGDS